MQIEMTSNYEDSVPIDVDSNGEEIVEVDSRIAKRPVTTRTGVYKPTSTDGGVGKPLKCQRKLTSIVWDHYESLLSDEEGNLLCKCKKCGQIYPGDSRYGTENLKRHMGNCKQRIFRDIVQLLLESCSGSLGNRQPEFDFNKFRLLLVYCVFKHELFQFVEYDGVRDMVACLHPNVKFVPRNTTRNDVIQLFSREKEKLKLFLESFHGTISFTSNCWTSLNRWFYLFDCPLH